jgi:hypothetical protein
MIKIYYDPNTGDISNMTIGRITPQTNNPFIIISKKIKINEWRVNLETLQLEQITP